MSPERANTVAVAASLRKRAPTESGRIRERHAGLVTLPANGGPERVLTTDWDYIPTNAYSVGTFEAPSELWGAEIEAPLP